MMSQIQDYSVQELQAELSRREEKRRQSSKPQMVQNPDYGKLIILCREYIEGLYSGKGEIKDMDHYVFEAAMTALFGDDVWNWITELT